MALSKFDDTDDSPLQLTIYSIAVPSHHMCPYYNSTHTLLAVKLCLELKHCTPQNVIDTPSPKQGHCKLTSESLQSEAVANSKSTILYWMIPKNVAHLITTNALQFQNYYYQHGMLGMAVYPGTMLFTGGVLKLKPLSFISQIEIDSNLVRFSVNETITIFFIYS